MVPALGKAMWVEDCNSSGERAALLSSPCSCLAWLGFFELFDTLTGTITSNLLVLRSPAWSLLPELSRRAAKALSLCHLVREGWASREPGTKPGEELSADAE